jgi:chromosome segregation ATPase
MSNSFERAITPTRRAEIQSKNLSLKQIMMSRIAQKHVTMDDDEDSDSEIADAEVVTMARQKALRLTHALQGMEKKRCYAVTDKKSLKEISDAIGDQTKRLSGRLTRRNANIENLKKKIGKLSSDLWKAEKDEKSLRKRGETANAEIDRQQKLVNARDQELARWKEQCQDKDIAAATSQSKIADLEAQILQQQQTIARRDERLQELRTMETQLQECIGTKEAKIQQMATDAEAKSAEIEMLWDRVALLQASSKKRAREE